MRLMIFICERTAVPGKEPDTKHARHEELVSRKGAGYLDAAGSREFHLARFARRLISETSRLNYVLRITDLRNEDVHANKIWTRYR